LFKIIAENFQKRRKMIKIKIADDERLGVPLDEEWVHQQINRRREAGESVCVRVSIEQNELNIMLSTKTCAATGRLPIIEHSPLEKKILQLWRERGLDTKEFTSSNLIAFVNQLQDLL
jgi:hypothetical protein